MIQKRARGQQNGKAADRRKQFVRLFGGIRPSSTEGDDARTAKPIKKRLEECMKIPSFHKMRPHGFIKMFDATVIFLDDAFKNAGPKDRAEKAENRLSSARRERQGGRNVASVVMRPLRLGHHLSRHRQPAVKQLPVDVVSGIDFPAGGEGVAERSGHDPGRDIGP